MSSLRNEMNARLEALEGKATLIEDVTGKIRVWKGPNLADAQQHLKVVYAFARFQQGAGGGHGGRGSLHSLLDCWAAHANSGD